MNEKKTPLFQRLKDLSNEYLKQNEKLKENMWKLYRIRNEINIIIEKLEPDGTSKKQQ